MDLEAGKRADGSNFTPSGHISFSITYDEVKSDAQSTRRSGTFYLLAVTMGAIVSPSQTHAVPSVPSRFT